MSDDLAPPITNLKPQERQSFLEWMIMMSLYTPFAKDNPYIVKSLGFENEDEFNTWREESLQSGKDYRELAAELSTRADPDLGNSDIWENCIALLKAEEGVRHTVYKDHLGNLTVGVGHLVKPEDNLKLGDTISDAQLSEFLKQDAQHAYDAALKQANELGVSDAHFKTVLVSVNFQLGSQWTKKFPDTWQTMKNGDFSKAADMLENTLWNRQTQDRVETFQAALREIDADTKRRQFDFNKGDFRDKPHTRREGPDFSKGHFNPDLGTFS